MHRFRIKPAGLRAQAELPPAPGLVQVRRHQRVRRGHRVVAFGPRSIHEPRAPPELLELKDHETLEVRQRLDGIGRVRLDLLDRRRGARAFGRRREGSPEGGPETPPKLVSLVVATRGFVEALYKGVWAKALARAAGAHC